MLTGPSTAYRRLGAMPKLVEQGNWARCEGQLRATSQPDGNPGTGGSAVRSAAPWRRFLTSSSSTHRSLFARHPEL